MPDLIANLEMCLAQEWCRDGRGLWAMRACLYHTKHGGQHAFGSWRYNVQPPADLSALLSAGAAPPIGPDTPYCGVELVGGWCKRAVGHDGEHACS